MSQYQPKELFHLYTDLVDGKIDMAATKAIDRVLERIADLKGGMDQRFSAIDQRFVNLENGLEKRFTKIDQRFTKVDHRVNSTKASLNSLNRNIALARKKFIEYSVRAIWAAISVAVVYGISHLYLLFK
jgi:hypothetical protein